MNTSLELRAPELIRERGLDFNRENLDELRLLLVREKDLDLVHAERESIYETLALVVSDPAYRGDLTRVELGLETKEDFVEALVANFQG